MTPTQFKIIEMSNLLFSELVTEEQLKLSPPTLLSPTTDEIILCQLDEEEIFFLNMIPDKRNKELKVTHLSLRDCFQETCWMWIRQRHNLQSDVIGLRAGYMLVTFTQEKLDAMLGVGKLFGLPKTQTKTEPKEMN